MVQRRLLLVLTTLFFLVAARQRAVRHPAAPLHPEPPRDVFTYSQPSAVAVDHVDLDLTVDFAERRLRGSATLRLDNRTATRTLVLDTYDLAIEQVVLDGATPANWSVDDLTLSGAPLTIAIEPQTRFVTIHYATSPGAAGLNWNTAAQTVGRVEPFVYTLNEPIDARSWIPIQDTPAARMTYSATLRVPPGMLALMSANGNPQAANETGVYSFHMPYRIPAYLISLAVGRLEYRAFDARTGVYAEPELIDDAAWELQYLPDMLDVAEDLAGPLPVPRHDLLLMPPTFTVGGMEHPMLNFINPFSVVSGNRPAAPDPKNLIAHELAHSWAGNSTTLATWNDVWLNEGITSYLAARILEELIGVERVEMAWFFDRRNYASYAQNADPESTKLHRDVLHPGLGFDSTAYTKGALFIRTLEDRIGRTTFDDFLREYFATFSYRWVDDRTFLELLRSSVLASRPGLEQQLQLSEWIYAPGLPSNVTAPASSAVYDRVWQRAASFISGSSLAQLGAASWPAHETDLFLQMIPASSLRPRMAEVDSTFGLSMRVTPPFVWLLRAITFEYQPSAGAIERAVARGGTNGAIVQLYATMLQVPGGRDRALAFFAKYRDRYHDNIEARIAEMLGLVAGRQLARDAA